VHWLSLFPAVDRVLKNWKPVHSYSLSQGEEETNPLIWTSMKGQDNCNDDKLTLHDCYIYFLHTYMSFGWHFHIALWIAKLFSNM
jgi:hypothetical protein